jgi:vancomycin resistance protein YoaR
VRRGAAIQRPRWTGPGALSSPQLGPFTPWLLIAAAVAIFVGASIGLLLASGDRIVTGVRVMGVDLGGRTRVEARSLLHSEIASLLQRPVTLKANGQEWQMPAEQVGVTLDPDALVEDAFAVGHSGNPVQRVFGRWGALLFGQRMSEPLLQLDTTRTEIELAGIAADVDHPMQNAHVELAPVGEDYSVVIVPEQAGTRVDYEQTTTRIRRAVAAGLPATVDIAMQADQPTATRADFEGVKAQADRILAQPVVLTLDDRRYVIARPELAQALEFDHAVGQSAQLSVNPGALQNRFEQIARDVERRALDARFSWSGGILRVIRDSQDGRKLDVDALGALMRDRVVAGDRTIALPVAVAQPSIRSSDAPKLGIRDVIKEGRTAFAGSVPEKQHNIGLAASRLNGVVVPPGGLFSFNKEVGPTTLDAGFQTGWGITTSANGARTIPSVAGGICQVATTLFQPVFHAGYQIEKRSWHLYWINSYGQPPLGMKGLDATVDEEAGLDLQFVNNTDNYMLIQSRVEGTNLIFGLYGTKPTWDVKVDGPVITNVVTADTTQVRQAERSMPVGRTLAVEAAQDGFDSTITRTVTQGDNVRTLRLTSKYVPSRNVVLYGTGGA